MMPSLNVISSPGLTMFVVYHRATDYPGKVVVRRWAIVRGEPVAEDDLLVICDTAEEARDAIRATREGRGMVRITRYLNDDPAILETWL